MSDPMSVSFLMSSALVVFLVGVLLAALAFWLGRVYPPNR